MGQPHGIADMVSFHPLQFRFPMSIADGGVASRTDRIDGSIRVRSVREFDRHVSLGILRHGLGKDVGMSLAPQQHLCNSKNHRRDSDHRTVGPQLHGLVEVCASAITAFNSNEGFL